MARSSVFGLVVAVLLGGCSSGPVVMAVVDAGHDARSDLRRAAPCFDSDGDGLLDELEDRDGDGLLGCCRRRCAPQGAAPSLDCPVGADGCGPGQRCTGQRCWPARTFACSFGETAALRADSFGDGRSDFARSTAVCRHHSATNRAGHPCPRFVREEDPISREGFRWALPAAAATSSLTLPPGRRDRALAVDLSRPAGYVAAFGAWLVEPTQALGSEHEALAWALERWRGAWPGLTLVARQRGRRSTGYPVASYAASGGCALLGLRVDVEAATEVDLGLLRNALLSRLLSAPEPLLQGLPPASGGASRHFVLRASVLRSYRHDVPLARDAAGCAREAAGSPADRWAVVLVALAAASSSAVAAADAVALVDPHDVGRSGQLAYDVCESHLLTAPPGLQPRSHADRAALGGLDPAPVQLFGQLIPRSFGVVLDGRRLAPESFSYDTATRRLRLRGVAWQAGGKLLVGAYRYSSDSTAREETADCRP